ncbi:MAG TPA: prolyl oligopeptidase family serine peptidase [Thermoanaerobaculia bacterium]|nr:prolyl oligopeptidase family serine peptidase [Thermoanaerobaculia bacterium]
MRPFPTALVASLMTLALSTEPVLAADATVPVPPSIETRNVPALPIATRERLLAYSSFRSAGLADWHPTERRLLVLTRFGESTQLHEVKSPGAARYQLTFFDEPVGGGLYRPGQPEQLAFLRDEGGTEQFQVYLFDRRDGRIRRATDGTSRHESPSWSPDGAVLAYTGNARNVRDSDLYLWRPDTGEERRLVELTGSWSVLDWSPDGKQLLLLHFVSAVESHVWRVELATGSLTAVSPREEPAASYSRARWSPDGASIYLATDRGSELQRLVRLDLENGLWTVLTSDLEWDVESFDLSSDGSLIAFSANEDGISRLRLLDTGSGEPRPAATLPAGRLSGLRFRPGSSEVGFALSWPRSPNDVYSFDPARGQLERWTESETGGLDPLRFAEPQLVRFPTFDRLPAADPRQNGPVRTIPAFVYRPDPKVHPGPRPVFVSIHGGPESQARPGFQGGDNYLINELGVALIVPNVRGSNGYGRSYLNLDNGRLREGSVKDIGALLDWIATQPDLDAKRVVVGGGSYGGYMVLACLVFYPERLAGGYDSVGISNFVTFLTNTQDYRRDLRRVEYGDERDPEMRRFLESISPLNQVERIRGPLLVAQGANDPRVPLSESTQMVDALEKRGVETWYVVGKDEGHGFRKKRNADYLQVAFVEFLRKVMKL